MLVTDWELRCWLHCKSATVFFLPLSPFPPPGVRFPVKESWEHFPLERKTRWKRRDPASNPASASSASSASASRGISLQPSWELVKQISLHYSPVLIEFASSFNRNDDNNKKNLKKKKIQQIQNGTRKKHPIHWRHIDFNSRSEKPVDPLKFSSIGPFEIKEEWG